MSSTPMSWHGVTVITPDREITVAVFRDPKLAHAFQREHAEHLMRRYSTAERVIVTPQDIFGATLSVPTSVTGRIPVLP